VSALAPKNNIFYMNNYALLLLVGMLLVLDGLQKSRFGKSATKIIKICTLSWTKLNLLLLLVLFQDHGHILVKLTIISNHVNLFAIQPIPPITSSWLQSDEVFLLVNSVAAILSLAITPDLTIIHLHDPKDMTKSSLMTGWVGSFLVFTWMVTHLGKIPLALVIELDHFCPA